MRKKRFLATILAASMVMGNVVMASASSITQTGVSHNAAGSNIPEVTQQVTGTGYLSDTVQDKVFRVVVPAQRTAGEADLFDFIMDPQQLIKATGGSKYISGADLAVGKKVSINSYSEQDSTLYFVNSANGVKTLSNTSDALEIINKSTMDVDVSVNASVTTTGTGLTVSTDKTFKDNKNPSVYLAMIANGKADAAVTLSTGDARVATGTMGNAKEFYVVSENNGSVSYNIPSMNATTGKAESENAYKKFTFQLTGAVNKDADWVNPQVTGTANVAITYHLTEHVDKAPSIAQTSYRMSSGQDVDINVDLGVATAISSIKYSVTSGEKVLDPTNYQLSNGVLKIKSAYIDSVISAGVNSRSFTIEFNDAAKTKVIVTLARS